ncbi:MAG TPA: RNA 2',3'-cyclic phosphodiesterase [Phycisphaerales bacterium]|nr:RNA 2',3'-cyclic phosphodiesterase [Phycisphaerales bacterium]
MLRLFVAAYPPPDLAASLLAHTAALNIPGAKPVAQDQLHLTLQFIGDTDPRDMNTVRESVARSVSGLPPAVLRVERLQTMPPRRPHLIAAILDPNPTISELHRRLALRLARNKEKSRPYLPHMTTARFRDTRQPEVKGHLNPAPEFTVTEVLLVRSVLKSSGAEHHVEARFEFA